MSLCNYNRDDFVDWFKVGEGAYGKVYSASFYGQGTQVAIKISKRKGTAYEELNRMRQLQHPNIVCLFGTIMPSGYEFECNDPEYYSTGPWLVMEYMPNGSLQDYIRNYPGGCPYYGMITMASGIAAGMAYLHHEANIVHKDLATRNILVGNNWNVKICDFGLCANYVYEDEYFYGCSGRPCPIRWMSPENLPGVQGKFSRKGDVWAFGCVLFEIWSRGLIPFMGLQNHQVIQYVKQGGDPLTLCHTSSIGIGIGIRSCVKELMKECWAYQPLDRPNFKAILQTLNCF